MSPKDSSGYGSRDVQHGFYFPALKRDMQQYFTRQRSSVPHVETQGLKSFFCWEQQGIRQFHGGVFLMHIANAKSLKVETAQKHVIRSVATHASMSEPLKHEASGVNPLRRSLGPRLGRRLEKKQRYIRQALQ